MNNKKLHKIEEGKMICGVCTGLAEYFNADVTLVRLITAAACLFSFVGIFAYFIAAAIIPDENSTANSQNEEKSINNDNIN